MNTIEQGELAREIPPTTDNEDLAVKKTTKTQAAIENEILIEFHSDIDTYVGQYQVDRVTEQYHLTPIDTIAQSNITVMSVSTGSSDITSGLITKIIPTSPDIDSVISTISQDPRVAHVQKNMIYRISSNTTSSIAPKDTIP